MRFGANISAACFDKPVINIYQVSGNFKCIAPVSHGVLLMAIHCSPFFCLFIFSYYWQLGARINPGRCRNE